jgi:pyruvate dehydrogenase E2 component (dihydrolipoamide acetyltransferase)
MRRAVASRLTQSKREAPHFYLNATLRVDALLALRETINASSPTRVSINDFFVKAVAKTLGEFPEMNVNWTDDAVRRFEKVDISVAINTERGLVTPVLRGAETLTLTQISTQIREFAGRAKEGRLKQQELEGGVMTVTNLGMFGVESFSAIINPPQVGILAVGAVVKQPVVDDDGSIVVASTATVTISADHRPVDGVLVAQWLQRFKELIENPITILA